MLQFTAYCFAEEVYIFLFLLECLRWGPTSLQTVMRNVIEHLQFVRSWGPEIKIKKYILLLCIIIGCELRLLDNGFKNARPNRSRTLSLPLYSPLLQQKSTNNHAKRL